MRLYLPSFSLDVDARGMADFGQGGDDIFLTAVACDGTEQSLGECVLTSYPGPPGSNCDHSEDAGVRCGGKTTYIHNDSGSGRAASKYMYTASHTFLLYT